MVRVIYAAEDGEMVLNDRTRLFSKVIITKPNIEDALNDMWMQNLKKKHTLKQKLTKTK